MLHEVNRFLARPARLRGRRRVGRHAVRAASTCGSSAAAAYLAQGYYASMGFGVPGALGAQLGTGRAAARPLRRRRLPDDRARRSRRRRATASTRSCWCVNNGGWQIFRPVVARTDLLDVPPWPYARLAEAWGGRGFRVEPLGELRDALAGRGAHQVLRADRGRDRAGRPLARVAQVHRRLGAAGRRVRTP